MENQSWEDQKFSNLQKVFYISLQQRNITRDEKRNENNHFSYFEKKDI